QSRKQPKLQNPKWSTDKAGAGEKITLSVDLIDQYDFANVTFKIWEKGADREKNTPVAVLKGQNFDGKAEVTWQYSVDAFVFESEENPLVNFAKDKLGVDIPPQILKLFIRDYEAKYENPAKETARFIFTCKSFRCKEVESPALEVGDNLYMRFHLPGGKLLKNVEYTIIGPDGKKIQGKTGEDGSIKEKALIPGRHNIKFNYSEESN
ncbi:MAG: hypothetical protein JXJ04_14625, partial [Spirochaetales bacterium]|nr:hypothetical protein [Spirochaetales bacterium]